MPSLRQTMAMSSHRSRNNQRELNGDPAQTRKSRETSIQSHTTTSLTFDSDHTSQTDVSNERVASSNKVMESLDDLAAGFPIPKNSEGRTRNKSKTMNVNHVQQNQDTNHTTCNSDRHQGNPPVGYTVEEIKRQVLKSIPQDLRVSIRPEIWDHIFNDASDSVFSQELMCLGKDTTDEDVKDLVSFISVYVQREIRGQSQSESNPVFDTSSFKLRSKPLDAMTLILESIPASVSLQGDDFVNMSKKPRGNLPNISKATPASPTVSNKDRSCPSVPLIDGSLKRAPTETIPRLVATPSRERSITFSRVEIRYYEQILSDNPAVTTGPPIGIGWKYRVIEKDISVDSWEYLQSPNRRYLMALVTSRHERTNRLYDLGYTQKDIAVAIRDVLRIKNQRKQSFHNIRFEKMEEIIEKTIRRLKNVLTLGMAKRHETRLVACYRNK